MQVVTWIVAVIHILASLTMILLILLHAGRGGGLSDVFGGGMVSSQLGGSTLAERNLDRITVLVAIVFGITTISLTWLIS